MFAVIFEVNPKPGQSEAYLDNAKMLKPELVQIDGFIENIRYKSLTREGWILSLSDWRDEKSVVRWRTQQKHHLVQERGRLEILADYRLRVGEIAEDTRLPAGYSIVEQRFDSTETGKAKAITLITAKRPARFAETSNPADCSEYLGLDPYANGLLEWDVCEAILTPGDLVLLQAWETHAAAAAFEDTVDLPVDARLQRVRIVRDYGMFDRREAPQYYPDAKGA